MCDDARHEQQQAPQPNKQALQEIQHQDLPPDAEAVQQVFKAGLAVAQGVEQEDREAHADDGRNVHQQCVDGMRCGRRGHRLGIAQGVFVVAVHSIVEVVHGLALADIDAHNARAEGTQHDAGKQIDKTHADHARVGSGNNFARPGFKGRSVQRHSAPPLKKYGFVLGFTIAFFALSVKKISCEQKNSLTIDEASAIIIKPSQRRASGGIGRLARFRF